MMLRIIAASSLTILTATAAIGSLPANAHTESSATKTKTVGVTSETVSTKVRDDDMTGVSTPLPIQPVPPKGGPIWGSTSIATTARMLEDSNIAERVAAARRTGSMHKSLEVRAAVEVEKTPVRLTDLGVDQQGNYLGTGRLLIKFKNDVKARASIFPGMPVVSLTGRNTLKLNDIVADAGATVRQAINMTEAEIEEVRQICFDRSNRIQPDFASMMKVEFPGGAKPNWNQVLRTAQEINALPEIEYVYFEPVVRTDQAAPQNCGNPPAYPCNRPNPTGFVPDLCWNGDDSTPGEVVNPLCNDPTCAGGPTCIVGCNDENCCNTVSSNPLYEYCNDDTSGRGWDVACAAFANQACQGTVFTPNENPNLASPDRYDPCLSTYDPDCADPATCTQDPTKAARRGVFSEVATSLLQSCYEANPSGVACQDPACCATICVDHPLCCTSGWDEACAGYANSGLYEPCIGEESTTPTPVMGMGGPYMFMPQINNEGATSRETVFNWGDMAGAWPPAVDNFNTFFTGASYNGNVVWLPENPTPAERAAWEAFYDFDAEGRPQRDYQGWGGTGLDIDLAAQTIGVIWRLYGGGADNPVIAEPNKVWLGGAEWEVVPLASCTSSECIPFGGTWDPAARRYTPPSLPTPLNPENQLKHPFSAFCADLSTNYSELALRPTGERQQVAVCEFSAYAQHEEWTERLTNPNDATSTRIAVPNGVWPQIKLEDGVVMELSNEGNANHGLACLGVTVAPNNGFGVTGIAPYAQGWFFAIESVNEGSRIETCFASMIADLPEGSIVTNSWGTPGPCGEERGPLSAPYYTLIRAMTDAGLVVLQSAGNDSSPMGAEGNTEVDSGLIKVGAAYAGAPLLLNSGAGACDPVQCSRNYQRIGFSNYSTPESAGSVDMFAWGELGLTTGTGTVFRGEDNRPGIDPFERQYTRSYQGPTPSGASGFNGTSFACPQVAGSLALIQGSAEMFWGQPFNGDLMKATLRIPDNSESGRSFSESDSCQERGYPSCVEVCPQGEGFLGRKAETCQDCAGVLTSIGKAVRFRGQMISVATTPPVTPGDSLEVYTGTLIRGGVVSLTAPDGAFVSVVSDFAASGPGPTGVPYFGTGQTIDWGVTLRTPIDETTIDEAQLISQAKANGPLNIEVPFLKNQVTGRWDFIGSNILTSAPAQNLYRLNLFGAANAYFTPDFRVELRMYTIGLGFTSGGGFAGSWDYVTVNRAEPVGPL